MKTIEQRITHEGPVQDNNLQNGMQLMLLLSMSFWGGFLLMLIS